MLNEIGTGADLIRRIEKMEEELRSSATIIRVLSKQLEKLGIRFRVTRNALKEPIAEVIIVFGFQLQFPFFLYSFFFFFFGRTEFFFLFVELLTLLVCHTRTATSCNVLTIWISFYGYFFTVDLYIEQCPS